MTDFTVKRFVRYHKFYIGVWKKRKRGFVTVFRVKKGLTVKKVRSIVEKEIVKIPSDRIFRILKAFIYFYTTGDKVGQLRAVVYTQNPNMYGYNVMVTILKAGERKAFSHFPKFKRNYVKYVKETVVKASEMREINKDEFKNTGKQLDRPFIEVAGVGITRGGIRTVGFYL